VLASNVVFDVVASAVSHSKVNLFDDLSVTLVIVRRPSCPVVILTVNLSGSYPAGAM